MSSDFINYTFGKLIEDLRKIFQAGVAGIVNEMVENRLSEIDEIRERLIRVEKILGEISARGDKVETEKVTSADAGEKYAENEKCGYEGCENNIFSRGYCKNHYYQLKRKGLLMNIDRKKERKRCQFENCNNFAISRGLCKNHYYQLKRGTIVFENGKYIKTTK